ncbi:MAG: hypothetical protein J6Y17_03885 [Elusimicrobiaceae bacterium]|nr:hypothetical protein [Elusimicrobiaceae bacterium]
MKKILLPAFSTLLLVTAFATPQAKTPNHFSNALEQEISKKMLAGFASNRVRQMCQEWPTCMEWANNRAAKDSSFGIIDAEVERWVSKWENGEAVWKHRFYVKTQEDGKIKSYVFQRGEGNYSYAAPVLIKKFPGHPLADKPTEHIKQVYQRTGYLRDMENRDACRAWPGCIDFVKGHHIRRALISQYIIKQNAQGNSVWKRRLYVALSGWLDEEAFYFEATQTTPGGDYSYRGPVKMNKCPWYPDGVQRW